MSRIGRMPIHIPEGVEVEIQEDEVTVTGPRGQLSRSINRDMSVAIDGNTLTVARPDDTKKHCSLHGLTRSLIASMVEGVANGFEKKLELVGVGYRAEKARDNLLVRVGFSHPVTVTPLAGISLDLDTPTRIKVSGISKEMVGEMAAEIRHIRPPDAYKGKGIRYAGEKVRLKPGKAGKAIGKK